MISLYIVVKEGDIETDQIVEIGHRRSEGDIETISQKEK